jgi:murein DD-endopeptidase MepM/ murein hydrolase activator NlpD
MRFPLPSVPTSSYRGANGFGANRDRVRQGLRHGAVDLFARAGTPVLAIDEGTVTRGPYPFYSGTYALEVQHPQFLARYGEIAARAEVEVGGFVQAGQVIAYVGNQPGYDMLHLEMYSGEEEGDLTQMGNTPFDRRKDLIDPTPYVDRLTHTVANVEQAKYEFWTDKEGRKFLLASKKYLIDL